VCIFVLATPTPFLLPKENYMDFTIGIIHRLLNTFGLPGAVMEEIVSLIELRSMQSATVRIVIMLGVVLVFSSIVGVYVSGCFFFLSSFSLAYVLFSVYLGLSLSNSRTSF
jgi:hypothetical protein